MNFVDFRVDTDIYLEIELLEVSKHHGYGKVVIHPDPKSFHVRNRMID